MTDFAVPLQARMPAARRWLGWVVTLVAAGVFAAAGFTTPGSAYGVLFVAFGVLGLAYCVFAALLTFGPRLSDRPALLLTGDGVRVLRPWPLPAGDRMLAWAELGCMCAWTQGPPEGGRGGTAFRQLYLSFLPVRPDGAARAMQSGAEILATKVAELPVVPTLRWTVRVTPRWQVTVDELAAEIGRRSPEVPFADRRERPKPKRKVRKPRAPRPQAARPAAPPAKPPAKRPAAQ